MLDNTTRKYFMVTLHIVTLVTLQYLLFVSKVYLQLGPDFQIIRKQQWSGGDIAINFDILSLVQNWHK